MRYGRQIRKSQGESFGGRVEQRPRQKEIPLESWECHIADNGSRLGGGEGWKGKGSPGDDPTIIADRAAKECGDDCLPGSRRSGCGQSRGAGHAVTPQFVGADFLRYLVIRFLRFRCCWASVKSRNAFAGRDRILARVDRVGILSRPRRAVNFCGAVMSGSPVRERVGALAFAFSRHGRAIRPMFSSCACAKQEKRKQRERDGVSIFSRCFIGSNEPSPGYP